MVYIPSEYIPNYYMNIRDILKVEFKRYTYRYKQSFS
jgi:hypothetical protein